LFFLPRVFRLTFKALRAVSFSCAAARFSVKLNDVVAHVTDACSLSE